MTGDVSPIERGAVVRVPLDERWGMAQIVAIEADAIAVTLANAIWDCAPALLDWQHCGRAIVHIAVRPAALEQTEVIGRADVSDAARAAHATWREAPAGSRPITPAPLAVLIAALG